MGILSKLSLRGRKMESAASRLTLYAVAAADRPHFSGDEGEVGDGGAVLTSSADEEILEIGESADESPVVICKASQIEDEVILLAPPDRELEQAVPEQIGGSREELVERPDGWREVDESQWNLELLQAMDWKLFEALCAEAFRRSGYLAETTATGPDGGIDIVVRKAGDDGGGATIAVQCKCYSFPVGSRDVREFYGAATRAGHDRMFFITASDFNEHARTEFGSDSNTISLVDGAWLLRKIENLGHETAAELLQMVVADRATWQTPTCPSCDVKMLRRTARQSGKQFWGCPNFARADGDKCWRRLY